ncbi:hypothetical protein Vretifemale_15724 [Volvox reticuliferus]|uniref:Uncharacterized protein n=1 Tax=Volvox reticuliferus TaxID=1737510 RepID=A0A8J4FSZ6_9CHLO|nr:hypothetical protein Vretifemale_15724 [Volvox reticuliferus]
MHAILLSISGNLATWLLGEEHGAGVLLGGTQACVCAHRHRRRTALLFLPAHHLLDPDNEVPKEAERSTHADPVRLPVPAVQAPVQAALMLLAMLIVIAAINNSIFPERFHVLAILEFLSVCILGLTVTLGLYFVDIGEDMRLSASASDLH